uniref:hypothetical protein n=1 Tax=Enterococcus faecium TaxID=1352 RepID=UPI001F25ED84|nr:hypothetical protein [Enterococcus faecium]
MINGQNGVILVGLFILSEVVGTSYFLFDELRIAYAYYQEILQAFYDKEADIFFQLVKQCPSRFQEN